MSKLYEELPYGAPISIKPFEVAIPQESLDKLQKLLEYAPIGALTFESSQNDRRYGISQKWLEEAKDYWEKTFDWRKMETHINSFPQFTAPVTDDHGHEHVIHFVGLFSKKKKSTPLILIHGWPGSFLEFLPMLSLLQKTYSPETLPYSVVVPSLPGYAFSSKPPLDKDFDLGDVGYIFNQLMMQLGFGDGYIAQGGDLGSGIARIMGVKYSSCKGVHLNSFSMTKPSKPDGELLVGEKKGLENFAVFNRTGNAYGFEHGTRPSTIGLILASSPVALLTWIGEKFLEWTDEDPSLETILETVSLYWLTESFPTSIYPYRNFYLSSEPAVAHGNPSWYLSKPFGYSWFPANFEPIPRSWAATTGDLVFFRAHSQGGHFAALEKPHELLQDISDFINQVWKAT